MPREIMSGLSRRDERYLEIASNLAKSSDAGRYKHGAIIVKGGRVLSTGINKFKNHPNIFENKSIIKQKAHIHAEADAIRKAGDLKGATIYVARINKTGNTGLSRPCNYCYEKIIEAGITKIVYT